MTILSLKPLDPRLIYFVSTEIEIPLEELANFSEDLHFKPNHRLTALELPEICQMASHYFVQTLENPQISQDPLKKKIKLALALCLTFLHTNQVQIQVSEMELYQRAVDVGYDEFSESEFRDFLLENAQGPSPQTQWSMSPEILKSRSFL